MLENVWQSPGTRREAKQVAIKKMEIQLNLKELIQQLKNDEIAVVYRFYIVEES
jgi:hypothetical protein